MQMRRCWGVARFFTHIPMPNSERQERENDIKSEEKNQTNEPVKGGSQHRRAPFLAADVLQMTTSGRLINPLLPTRHTFHVHKTKTKLGTTR